MSQASLIGGRAGARFHEPRSVGTARAAERVRVSGKFFRAGGERWLLKGMTYGPFAPNRAGQHLPESAQLAGDLAHIRRLGATAIRLYHLPSPELLDTAGEHDLRVMIDVPWDKHRCFLEDWSAQTDALGRVRRAARELGTHPAVLAISVANEIPHDVVRFHGARRVERFVDDLLDASKQEAPDCLVTYTNYPSTEFLVPGNLDFLCFNVYLDDADVLGGYLDRLQHVAGPLPLVLGEYGLDSIRKGADAQANALRRHVGEVFGRGLAGSFIFSYTDDWYTGGQAITDWGFGITDRERVEKPAAQVLARAWAEAGRVVEPTAAPRVSVVVCSYNGGATLAECLQSLRQLDYPNYEIILVDDGSTDDTPAIAARVPEVRYMRQENRGLSAARNVGAEAATGEIVAYTDSDCVADEAWLLHLVRPMGAQGVDVIGGPNVPPASDSWTAKCVAASPGGPSHVMLDDRRAEHVPGCNMAFRRDKLLALGGFDPQFRQAGDDVDICWRFMDAGMQIGYAPAALVWHHRRNTVKAYLSQQKGYGRSEAMLQFKHPHRFNALGCSRWHGVIYGEGAVGLPVQEPLVYHGRFGSGLFQIIYRRNDYTPWAYVTLLEWHAVAVLLLLLGIGYPSLFALAALMVTLTLVGAARSARRAPLPAGAPLWCRPLLFVLHLAQPVVRAWYRYSYRIGNKRVPVLDAPEREVAAHLKRVGWGVHDMYWSSESGLGREQLLDRLEADARQAGWRGDFSAEWRADDAVLTGTPLHGLRLRAATEELGGPKRFTRVRCDIRLTVFARALATALALGLVATLGAREFWAAGTVVLAMLGLGTGVIASAERCRMSFGRLAWRAGIAAGLKPVPLRGITPAAPKAAGNGIRTEPDLVNDVDPDPQTTAVA
jgi:O-antigen biosynthesis protein